MIKGSLPFNFKSESVNFENLDCFREFLNILSISEVTETTKFE